MDIMNVGAPRLGISQHEQKIPRTSEVLAPSPQGDSMLSSMSVMDHDGQMDGQMDDQGTHVSGLVNKHYDTHMCDDIYADSRGSEGGMSESKDSGYGMRLEKNELRSPRAPNKKKILQNSQASMYLPKIPGRKHSKSGQGMKLKASKKIQPLDTRSKAQDDIDLDVNPEAVPFLPQSFMSSTVLKKIAVPKRHLDTFGGMEYNVTGRRGVILHTDRYQWASFRPLDGMSQRDRLLAELLYMEKLRGVKRRREVLPHRAQLDLVMGGKKIEMEERFDIAREIQKLKSLVLPQNAKDLFHGRGFRLPDGHGSVNPRGQPYDITEEISASAPALMQQPIRMNPDFLSQRLPSQASIFNSPSKLKKRGQLPSLNRGRDDRDDSPVLLSREKRTVTNLQARLSLPRTMRDESHPSLRPRHSVLPSVEANSLNRSPAAWVADQNRRILEGQDRVEVTVPHIEDDKSRIPDSDMEIDHTDLRPEAVSPEAPPPTTAALTVTSGPTAGGDGQSVSPVKPTTPHPLKGAELVESVPDTEKDQLRATFQRLDTDMDGNLNYNQLKTQIPDTLSQTQEVFTKQVYDIIRSNSDAFNVEDFMNMKQLTQALENLGGDAKMAFQDLDTNSLATAIRKFVGLFQQVDRNHRGKISTESLQEILCTGLEKDVKSDRSMWTSITTTMGIDSSSHVTKIEFLAHLPYFLSWMPKS
ncbi:uncharacterized protein LOC124126773 isoform X2 [Haliotis rufescens]|uniref:uncharacterized protein LOC124126773 isoform X2 n=1 Tax=Haliotis rufescens TaxID=6454 RepID=UPI00201E923A|nr:uncharacterized protein LOC124126773 isoform X2 [Haliotis rufescens]